LVALVGYFLLAGAQILDKFILEKSVPRPLLLTFYSTIFLLPLIWVAPFLPIPNSAGFLVAIISAFAFSAALYAMYRGFFISEVSHMGPFIGAIIPVFVLLLNFWFVKETISQMSLVGVALLVVGSFIMCFEFSQVNKSGLHWGILWGILSAFLFAISHVAAKLLYVQVGFASGLVWSRGLMGVVGILLLFTPIVRKTLFDFSKKQNSHKNSSLRQVALVGTNKALGAVGELLIQYSIAIGSVVVVSAMAGSQYALLVIGVALFTRFAPRWFKEVYFRKEIYQEVIGILFIAAGLALLIL